jgi:hypothetical protein
MLNLSRVNLSRRDLDRYICLLSGAMKFQSISSRQGDCGTLNSRLEFPRSVAKCSTCTEFLLCLYSNFVYKVCINHFHSHHRRLATGIERYIVVASHLRAKEPRSTINLNAYSTFSRQVSCYNSTFLANTCSRFGVVKLRGKKT